jgi:histidinol dehydrogenase
MAAESLKNSHFILLNSIDEALEFSNLYAPEHLILAVNDFENYIPKIQNAGSVFLGNYSCECGRLRERNQSHPSDERFCEKLQRGFS